MEQSNPALTKEDIIAYLQELPYDALLEAYLHAQENGVIIDESVDVDATDDTQEKCKKSEAVPSKSKSSSDDKRNIFRLEEVEKNRICPFCMSGGIYRHGVRKGIQRYICNSCHSVFTASTNTIMSGSHQSPYVWRSVIEDTIGLVSIAETASRHDLNEQTVWNMRHKILLALAKLEEKDPVILGEISELDETYVLESNKGKKLAEEDREPRQRGGKATKRGLSNEQVCVFAGIQREGGVYMQCINMGKPSKQEILAAFEGHLKDDSMYMTDGLAGYSCLKEVASCQVVNAKKEESSFYHLNHVNNVHSQFKFRYDFYRGVATKYINRYLALMDTAYKSNKEKVDVIFKQLCVMGATDLHIRVKNIRTEQLCTPVK